MTTFLKSLVPGSWALVGTAPTLLFTVLRVVAVYAVLLLLLRLTGRRQLGQLTPFDLLTLLLLANVVQNAMIGPDNSLLGGLIGATLLLAMNRFVSRSAPLRESLEGHPAVLVYRGSLMRDELAREGVSEEELAEAAREHGLDDLGSVDMAVLEMDGSISIIAKGAAEFDRLGPVTSRRTVA